MERPLPDDLMTKAARIRLLILDVDGVLTDGRLYFTDGGDEMKAFHSLDGHGLKLLRRAGLEIAIVTGRTSPLTSRRAGDLGISHLRQGREDKAVAVDELLHELRLDVSAVAYIGDDLPDLAPIMTAGLGIAVPNGHWYVRENADFCTEAAGGEGAVREVCDLILQARDRLAQLHGEYHPGGA